MCCSLGLPESTPETELGSVQPFWQDLQISYSRHWCRDRGTSVTIGRVAAVVRCELILMISCLVEWSFSDSDTAHIPAPRWNVVKPTRNFFSFAEHQTAVKTISSIAAKLAYIHVNVIRHLTACEKDLYASNKTVIDEATNGQINIPYISHPRFSSQLPSRSPWGN